MSEPIYEPGPNPTPVTYEASGELPIIPLACYADFDGSATVIPWKPALVFTSQAGHKFMVAATSETIAAGASASVSWFPRVDDSTTAAAVCPPPLTMGWYRNVGALNPLNCVAFGNGYWTIAGPSGALYYRASDPTGAWTSNTQGVNVWNGVAYGNGYWTVVGANGNLRYKATNPTGAWTSNAQGVTTWKAVAYANGYWVAVGLSGVLRYRATDPTGAWTANNLVGDLQGIAYANGNWVATGTGTIYTTTDPTGAWTDVTPSPTPSWWRVAYGGGYWVAAASHFGFGTGANIWYATDPTATWTRVFLDAGDANNLEGVAYGAGYFIVVGDAADLYYATTPTAWTRNAQSGGSLLDIAHDNGYWTAVGPGSGGIGNLIWERD